VKRWWNASPARVAFCLRGPRQPPHQPRPPAAAPPSLCFLHPMQLSRLDSLLPSRPSLAGWCRRLLAPDGRDGPRAKTRRLACPNREAQPASLTRFRPCIKACCPLVAIRPAGPSPAWPQAALPAAVHNACAFAAQPRVRAMRHVDTPTWRRGESGILSFTLFLSEPDAIATANWVLEVSPWCRRTLSAPCRRFLIRLPSTLLHRVEP